MRNLVVIFAAALAGCAGLQQQPQQTAALENVVLALLCAQTGVCLVSGGAAGVGGPGCSAPPIDQYIVPCQPTTGTPEQVKAALNTCVTNSVVLAAVSHYAQSVCGTTTTTTTVTPASQPAKVVTVPAPAPAARTLLILPRG